MTRQKHLKQIIRKRMERTGESYVTARRHVIAETPVLPNPATPGHVPGCNPGTTALRTLLTHAGVVQTDGTPLSEPLTFLLGGGVGMGVFQFRYDADDVSTFYMAGRHLWHDDHAFISQACGRLGLDPIILETTSTKRAATHLREAIAAHGPTVTWVDMSHLPYRGMPNSWSGSGYHVIVVHQVDESGDTAVVSDLADHPFVVPLAALAEARARIKKFKHRLLSVPAGTGAKANVTDALEHGARAGAETLRSGMRNFTLDALDGLAQRMRGTEGEHDWGRVFPRGRHLWTALTWLYECVEHYGSGGGLCRPMAALGFREAASLSGRTAWSELADRYDRLGAAWSDLAYAALPDAVPMLQEGRRLIQRRAERLLSGDASGPESLEQLWTHASQLAPQRPDDFPLGEAECVELRDELAERVEAIALLERQALAILDAS